MTNRFLRSIVAPAAVLFSAACVDLEVTNPNQPDIPRALGTPGDVSRIASSSVNSWWIAATHYEPAMMMQVTADHATANFGNFGMRFNNEEPRIAYANSSASGDELAVRRPWTLHYAALGAANDAISALDNGISMGSTAENERVRSAALFTQAATHSYLAMMFDQAFVVTAPPDPTNLPVLRPYAEVRDSAMALLDALIALTNGKTWAWDDTWLPLFDASPTATVINRIANTLAAQTLVLSARTSAENTATNWARVLTYADRGITGTGLTPMDFSIIDDGGINWYDYIKLYGNLHSWTRVDQRLINRMDPTIPARFNGITNQPATTPVDNRLQRAAALPCGNNPESCMVGNTSDYVDLRTVIGDPGRGIWMQSTFYHRRWRLTSFANAGAVRLGGENVNILAAQNNLMIAEALARTGGDLTRAANLVNSTRVTRGGLAPVAADANAILAAIEYEWDVETLNTHGLSLMNRRRWPAPNSIQAGTMRHLPVPARELEVLGLPVYTYGGVGNPDM